jgi:tetratricopeptide (TPR) repeat protein
MKGRRTRKPTSAGRGEGPRRAPTARVAALGAAVALVLVLLALRGAVSRAAYQRMPLPDLERFSREHPGAGAAAVLGRRLIEAGEFRRAAEALRSATDRESAPGDLWLLRAEAELRAGDDRLAYASARVGLPTAAHPARGHWILGQVAERAGSEEEAQAEFRRATDLDPTLTDAWLRRGRYSLRYSLPGTALEEFRRALAGAARSDDAAVGVAEALLSMGRLAEAEAEARNAVAWNPGSAKAHFWLGRILAARGGAQGVPGQAGEAEAEYKASISHSSEPGPAYHHLGAFYLQQGEVESAAEAFRAAIASQPLQKTSYVLLAQCYRRLGRAGDAERVLRTYRHLEEMDLASAQLEYQVWAAPRDAPLRLRLAQVYLKFGRPDLARAQVERARRLAPDSPDVKRMLAQLSSAARPSGSAPVPERGDEGPR